LVSATGNVVGGNLTTAGEVLATGTITGGNISTAGTVSATGTITGGNLVTAGSLTSVSLSATGNVTGGNLVTVGTVYGKDALFTGNLIVDGDTTYINISNLSVQDPIISLGTGANGAPLTVNDGKDRGELLNYFNTAGNVAQTAFVGYQNSTGKMIIAANVTANSDVITVSNYGTVLVGGLEGTTVSASGNVTGGNITTSGTGSIATLSVSTLANITASTTSTSTITGALRVAGGAGVVGNVYAGAVYSGGALVVTVDSTVDGGTY
jgi:hypothetical protein